MQRESVSDDGSTFCSKAKGGHYQDVQTFIIKLRFEITRGRACDIMCSNKYLLCKMLGHIVINRVRCFKVLRYCELRCDKVSNNL